MEGPVEIHPFPPFFPEGATHVIIGTFPTHARHWKFHAHYPGKATFFWRLISELYQRPFQFETGEEAACERLALCAEKGIAISDIIHACRRRIEKSSKDSDLIVVEKRNVLLSLKEHPSVKHIILTGSSGKVSAHYLFLEHLRENGVAYDIQKSKPPINGKFYYLGNTYQLHTLYSPSGLNIGRYRQTLEQFRQYLPK